MGEQFLIERAGNLGQENRVIVVLKELRFSGEPGMHGMPGFVRQGVNICKHILFVVHQNVRRRVVAAGGKCATSFPLRFVTIAPPATQTISECACVFLSVWSMANNTYIYLIHKDDFIFNYSIL